MIKEPRKRIKKKSQKIKDTDLELHGWQWGKHSGRR